MKLNPTKTEQTKARNTITTALALETTPKEINYLIEALLKLAPTETEQTTARNTLLTKIPHTNSRALYNLVGPLRRLTPVHDWLAALGIGSA